MTLFLHELKRNRLSLIIWSAAISFMLAICVFIYPEMQTQMGDMSAMFSDMGAFTDAFGMDQLNFGEFMGYFGIEYGNTLGMGGAIFAAILGATALSKEEKDRTAEFLLTHPISRSRIYIEKLLSALAEILILNIAVACVTALSIAIIGVEADAGKMALLSLANILLQVEVLILTFGISAVIKRGGLGIALGMTLGFYFLNILSNLTEELEFIKFITPYGYTDGSHIMSEGSLEIKYILVGAAFALVALLLSYKHYMKKDIT